MIICINGVNAMDISDNSTIGDSSTTIYVNGSYAGDIESGTQDNPYKQVSSAVGAATGGETIFIADGSYGESDKIILGAGKPLSFVGESLDGVVLIEDSSWQSGALYAAPRHAVERLLMYITGMQNIRDVILYPRTVGSIN